MVFSYVWIFMNSCKNVKALYQRQYGQIYLSSFLGFKLQNAKVKLE